MITTILAGTTHSFPDLPTLLARASPDRAGDRKLTRLYMHSCACCLLGMRDAAIDPMNRPTTRLTPAVLRQLIEAIRTPLAPGDQAPQAGPDGRFCVLSTWIDTTEGVTCSEIATKALLASASDFTSCEGGFDAVDCCANPTCVQSNADATRRPPRNAPATAAPKRVREIEDAIRLCTVCEL